MPKLAKVTVPRWFPAGSLLNIENSSPEGKARREWVSQMVEQTKVHGFVHGAHALGEYDIIEGDGKGQGLFESEVGHVLLLAGTLDGGGKVGQGLQTLCQNWTETIEQRHPSGGTSNVPPSPQVQYVGIDGAGHLPMIDSPDAFCDSLSAWLKAI